MASRSIDLPPRHAGLRTQVLVRREHPVPGAPDPVRVSVMDWLVSVGHEAARRLHGAAMVAPRRRR